MTSLFSSEELKEFQELYEMVLKTARRCTRDMKHMINELGRDKLVISKADWEQRLQNYEVLFGDTRDYRISLHCEIQHRDMRIKVLERLLEEAKNPKPPTPAQTDADNDDIPF